MKSTKFKTNIKCEGCVQKVTPHLNQALGEGNWEVNLTDPKRILTSTKEIELADLVRALEKAGYSADEL